MGSIANLLVRIGLDAGELTADLEKVNSRLQEAGRSAANASGGFEKLGSTLSSLGGRLTVGLSAPLGAFGASAVKAAGDIEALKLGLNTITGSAKETEVQFKRLVDIAKLPGLGLPEAVAGSIRLQAVGLSAQTSERYLRAFGNALAAVGRGRVDLDAVLVQLSQMASKGKVLAQDFKPILERVPQVAKISKDLFGTVDTEEIQKKGIKSQEFIEKIVTELEKLPKTTGGINNAFENLRDSFQQALAKMGEAIVRAVPDFQGKIDAIGNTALELADKFNSLPPVVQAAIVAIGGIAVVTGPAIFILGQMAQSIVALSTAVQLFQSLQLVSTFRNVNFALSNGLVGALSLGEKAMLGLGAAAAVVGGTIGGWAIGTWIRNITGLGSAVDDLWRKFDPLLQKIGLTTQKLPELSRAEADQAFASKKLEEAKTRLAAAHAAVTEKANAHAAATDRVTASHEKLGDPLRRTSRFLLQQLDIFERLAAAQKAYADALNTDLTKVSDIAAPTINPPEADAESRRIAEEIKKAQNLGAIIKDGVNQAEEAAAKQFPKVTEEVKKTTKTVSDFGRQVSTVLTDLGRGIADAIIHGRSIGDVFKQVGQSIAESIVRVAIEKGIKLLIENLDTVLSKLGSIGKKIADVFGGAAGSIGGSAGSGGGGSIPGVSGGGSASSGSGGLSGTLNLVTGAITAISSVVGNFQQAHANTELGRIEESTRYTQIRVANIEQYVIQYMPRLNDIHQRLIEISGNTFGAERGVSQLILNVDGRRLADALIPYIGRTIQVGIG